MATTREWAALVPVTATTLAAVNAYWEGPKKLFLYGLDDQGRPFDVALTEENIQRMSDLLMLAQRAFANGKRLRVRITYTMVSEDEAPALDQTVVSGAGPDDPRTGARQP